MNNLSLLTQKIKEQNQNLQQSIESQLQIDKQQLQQSIEQNLNDARSTIAASIQEYQNKLKQQIKQEQQAITAETIREIFSSAIDQITHQKLDGYQQAITQIATEINATQSKMQDIDTQLEWMQQEIKQQEIKQQAQEQQSQALTQYQAFLATLTTQQQQAQQATEQSLQEQHKQALTQYQAFIASMTQYQSHTTGLVSQIDAMQENIRQQAESINLSQELTQYQATTERAIILITALVAVLLLWLVIITAITSTEKWYMAIILIVLPIAIAAVAIHITAKKIKI